MYEVKYHYIDEQPEGKQVKKTRSLLVEAPTFGGAEESAYMWLDAEGYKEPEVIAVKRSNIMEEVNQRLATDNAYIVTLQVVYNIDGREKKRKYNVLLWSFRVPSITDNIVKEYIEEMNSDATEFKIVGIKESTIQAVL